MIYKLFVKVIGLTYTEGMADITYYDLMIQ